MTKSKTDHQNGLLTCKYTCMLLNLESIWVMHITSQTTMSIQSTLTTVTVLQQKGQPAKQRGSSLLPVTSGLFAGQKQAAGLIQR